MPLLTIVTINKDNSHGLVRTTASLSPLHSNKEIEFICIDGGSIDSSLAVAATFYSHNKLVSEPDRGIYAAMNKGLSVASGEWIIWINSGDEFLAGCWPQLRLKLLSSNSAVICGAAEIIHAQSGALAYIKDSQPSDLPWYMVNHSSSIFRRSIFDRYGMYRESLTIAADRQLMVQLFHAGEKITYTRLCISRFWLGGISDKQHLIREKENLFIDLQAGLISKRAYRYALLRQYFYHIVVKLIVLYARRSAKIIGYEIPPLGRFAGILGEPSRDMFEIK